MGSFTIKAGIVSTHVQSRTKPIPIFGRRLHRHRIRERDLSDSDERVRNDLPLEGDLTGVGNVRVDTSAAQRIVRFTTVR